ncbi:Glyoxylase, beta-lactamase superfamily II [Alteribacillus persepolensis]|uniref:Glyoxylase, beta-lactamase superfamily II n=1 Tax=Alteribacillus persepolensis TaxID=568899 RepID=A0A1G8ETX0_9BACI|nr:MBL fold metallo-hydrolase [Alteribacillus persepolensis]SDH73169.1 Glyoxylase, beta-lactamase superfamily II [Alteribacillus persepolensis]
MTDTLLPVTSVTNGMEKDVTKHLFFLTNQVVNLCFYEIPNRSKEWILIDAGMPASADIIQATAKEHFGEDHKPQAIVLTHGHFDHVGALEELIDAWNVPVYAHEQELPYLTGKKDYPEPDNSVEGGLVAKMSRMFPNEGIDVGTSVQPLPEDESVPFMEGWKWVHTPGHTPGHVSFFHEQDRLLVAGDAFVTVKQESLFKVMMQEKEISGPPRYLTTDWEKARTSVETLQALHPAIAVTGHGLPMEGEELSGALDTLVRRFDEIAIPDHGRFV